MLMRFAPGFLLVLFFSICAGLGTGCSDDSEPGLKCTQEDSNQCSSTYASCNSGCVADEDCLHQCQLDYCDCLSKASCDPPDECKTSGTTDGSTLADGGSTADSATGADSTTSDSIASDSTGTTPDHGAAFDTGAANCSAQASQACSTALATCTGGCGSDMGCLDTCQNDFCSCMTDANCDVGEDCHGL